MKRKNLLLVSWLVFFLAACGVPSIQKNGFIPDGILANSAVVQEMLIPAQKNCLGSECIKTDGFVSVHQPFTDGKCAACHSSDGTVVVPNTQAEIDLCLSCHSDASLGNSHRYGGDMVDPTTDGMLTCLSCHLPHGAENTYLLKLDGKGELCVSCHTEFLQ